jgi:hypothetical protein
MRKHRALLIATPCVALALVLAVLLAHDDEPRYKGRSLSKWLQVYSDNSMTPDSPELTEAVQAIRAIGTNAFPSLLKWIRQDPPSWHRAAHRKLPLPLTYSPGVKLLIDGPGYERANGVMIAFAVLGTNAAPAIPDLVALMKDTNHVDRAMGALSGVGAPALPHMLAALTDTNQTGRSDIPFYIREMAKNVGTNPCLPALKSALQDPDPAVRAMAAWALHTLAPDFPTNAPAK